MRIDAFDFDLPPELIAQRPVEPRDAARLLHVHDGRLGDRSVRDLPDLLAPGNLLVFNDTRVIPARLAGRRGEATVSVTLHQAAALDSWLVFAKPGKRLRVGDRVFFEAEFSAEVVEKRPAGDILLRFDRGGAELIAALHQYGSLPLPPYIRGGIADARDRDDYQTLFAKRDGAVAAPTASLHFTPELVESLAARGIGSVFVTLHVGAGTFLPVKVDDTDDHVMHAEWGSVPAEAARRINETRAAGGRIVPVGTTSLRLIESAVRDDRTVRPYEDSTRLFITPGYRFRAADRLMTNFHLPRSTLFMLVSAFAGRGEDGLARMQAAYAHARASGYRFYSYGDASLIDRPSETN